MLLLVTEAETTKVEAGPASGYAHEQQTDHASSLYNGAPGPHGTSRILNTPAINFCQQ